MGKNEKSHINREQCEDVQREREREREREHHNTVTSSFGVISYVTSYIRSSTSYSVSIVIFSGYNTFATPLI